MVVIKNFTIRLEAAFEVFICTEEFFVGNRFITAATDLSITD